MSVTTIPNTGLDVPNYGDTNFNTLWGTMTIAVLTFLGNQIPRTIAVAISDETSSLTTGTAKVTFRMPHAMTVTAVRASVTTAPTGSTLIVDINENGTSILSTKLSIDAGEKTSTTAATAAVISDTALADDAEITIDIDQVGSTIAGAGLKIYIIGKIAQMFLINPFAFGSGNLFAATPYTGNGSTQSIVTGQNLAAGGLTLLKSRDVASTPFGLWDTERGAGNALFLAASTSDAAESVVNGVSAFNGNGFSLGTNTDWNQNAIPFMAFTFIKQAGYMDAIPYNGTAPTTNVLTHDNGATPEMIIFKSRSNPYRWWMYHKSLNGGTNPERYYIDMRDSQASVLSADFMLFTAPTSTEITLGNNATINQSGQTFIAYPFVGRAGASSFGAYNGTTTVNTGVSSLKAVMVKRDGVGDWFFFYNDGGSWYYFRGWEGARTTGLISVSGGDFTLSGDAAAGTGIYAAWG